MHKEVGTSAGTDEEHESAGISPDERGNREPSLSCSV